MFSSLRHMFPELSLDILPGSISFLVSFQRLLIYFGVPDEGVFQKRVLNWTSTSLVIFHSILFCSISCSTNIYVVINLIYLINSVYHVYIGFNSSNISNTTGTISGTGMVYPLEAQEFIPVFVLSLFCSIFSFLCVVLSINVWLLVPILSSLPLNCMLLCDLRPRLSVCYYQSFLPEDTY